MFKRCMELCSALLTSIKNGINYVRLFWNCVGSISLITRLAVFLSLVQFRITNSELRSERGFSNYVRQVDW